VIVHKPVSGIGIALDVVVDVRGRHCGFDPGGALRMPKVTALTWTSVPTGSPHISQALGTVVRKALSLDPSRRFESAQSLSNALAQAVRGSRDWRRVVHSGHGHCLESPRSGQRAAVAICSEPVGTDVQVRAVTLPSRRRIAGIPDAVVRPSELPKRLQQLVRKAN
jgi:hypothetical protein